MNERLDYLKQKSQEYKELRDEWKKEYRGKGEQSAHMK